MNTPALRLGPEPVLLISVVQAVLIVAQAALLSLPPDAEAALSGIIVLLGAVLARSQVTPTALERARNALSRSKPPEV